MNSLPRIIRSLPLLLALATGLHAGTMYTISFNSVSGTDPSNVDPPSDGSLVLNTTVGFPGSGLSNFIIHWHGASFDFTSQANNPSLGYFPTPLSAGGCPDVNNGDDVFSYLSGAVPSNCHTGWITAAFYGVSPITGSPTVDISVMLYFCSDTPNNDAALTCPGNGTLVSTILSTPPDDLLVRNNAVTSSVNGGFSQGTFSLAPSSVGTELVGATPEPASFELAALGCSLLGLHRVRKRR